MQASSERTLEDLLNLAPDASQLTGKPGKGKKKEKKSILGMELFDDGIIEVDLCFMRPCFGTYEATEGRRFGLAGDLHLEIITSTSSNYRDVVSMLKQDAEK